MARRKKRFGARRALAVAAGLLALAGLAAATPAMAESSPGLPAVTVVRPGGSDLRLTQLPGGELWVEDGEVVQRTPEGTVVTYALGEGERAYEHRAALTSLVNDSTRPAAAAGAVAVLAGSGLALTGALGGPVTGRRR